MLSDLFQAIWDTLMHSKWIRRITFAVLLGLILYFWGLNWTAIGIWAFVVAIHEAVDVLSKWWRGRRQG